MFVRGFFIQIVWLFAKILPARRETPLRMENIQATLATGCSKTITNSDRISPKQKMIPSVSRFSEKLNLNHHFLCVLIYLHCTIAECRAYLPGKANNPGKSPVRLFAESIFVCLFHPWNWCNTVDLCLWHFYTSLVLQFYCTCATESIVFPVA